jgi:hypothetical protein
MKIQFSTEGAAFKSGYGGDDTLDDIYTRQEVARILKKIASHIESGSNDGIILDINGNNVGNWEL